MRPNTSHPLNESILRVLVYSDLFDYPLTAAEVFQRLPLRQTSPQQVQAELDQMTEAGVIFRWMEFYALNADPALGVRRRAANEKAEELMKLAAHRARLIARFPYVRSVMVSGSLSKGYADQHSDIDFFIVTAPNRLWIARMLLVVYKRLFLHNSHKHFCINYFVDEHHLTIEDKNLFTATELATLIPLEGTEGFETLIAHNAWMLDYYPNFQQKIQSVPSKAPRLRRWMESLLEWCAPDALNRAFMQITWKRWVRLYGHRYEAHSLQRDFRSTPGISKNHPNSYQQRVVNQFEERLEKIKAQLEVLPAAS